MNLYKRKQNNKIATWFVEIKDKKVISSYCQEGFEPMTEEVELEDNDKAKSFCEQLIKNHLRTGWVKNVKEVVKLEEMKFEVPPKNFTFAHPAPISKEKTLELIQSHRLRMYAQVFGIPIIICVDKDDVRIFSLDFKDIGTEFPSLLKSLRDFTYGKAYNSIFLADIVNNDGRHLGEYKSLMECYNSNLITETQIKNKGWGNNINLVIYDIIFYFGRYVFNEKFDHRQLMIQSLFGVGTTRFTNYSHGSYINLSKEIITNSMEQFQSHIGANSYLRGLILRDSESTGYNDYWRIDYKKIEEFDVIRCSDKVSLGQDKLAYGEVDRFANDDLRDKILNMKPPFKVKVEFEQKYFQSIGILYKPIIIEVL